jgi:hypothetical protein
MPNNSTNVLEQLFKQNQQLQGRMILQNISQEEGLKALKGLVSNNLKEYAKNDPVGLASMVASGQQADTKQQTKNVQDSINPSIRDPFKIPSNVPPKLAEAIRQYENNQTDTKTTDTAETTEKKGYGWPIALMMMGRGLQGGNPMDVLSGLMQHQQSKEKLNEESRQFDETLTLKKKELETTIASAQTIAEQEHAKLQLRHLEAMVSMVNSVKDASKSFLGGQDTNKLLKNLEAIYGKTINQLKEVSQSGETSFDEKGALEAGWTPEEIAEFKKKIKK